MRIVTGVLATLFLVVVLASALNGH